MIDEFVDGLNRIRRIIKMNNMASFWYFYKIIIWKIVFYYWQVIIAKKRRSNYIRLVKSFEEKIKDIICRNYVIYSDNSPPTNRVGFENFVL